jgi:hypothetical protein
MSNTETETQIDVKKTCNDLANKMGPDDRYAICEAGPEHLIFVQRSTEDPENICAITLEGSDAILEFMAMIAASIGTDTLDPQNSQDLADFSGLEDPCKALMCLDKTFDPSKGEAKTWAQALKCLLRPRLGTEP